MEHIVLTEEELNRLYEQALGDNAKAEYEIAMVAYIEYRACYTLQALHDEVLAALKGIISQRCQPEASLRLSAPIEKYHQSPSWESLKNLINSILVDIKTHDEFNLANVFLGLLHAMKRLKNNVTNIVNKHFPEWEISERLRDAVTYVTKEDASYDFNTLVPLITELSALTKKCDIDIKQAWKTAFLVKAACKDYYPAVEELGRIWLIHTKRVTKIGDRVFPVVASVGNEDYPSIVTGQYKSDFTDEDRRLLLPHAIPFFDSEKDPRNRFVLVSHDENSYESQKRSIECTKALLASIMAWAGPHSFSIDVVDFESSGIGSSFTPFLPSKEINVLPKIEEWSNELESLTDLMAKRSVTFSNFIHYNREHPDKKVPIKLVTVQDFSGILIGARKHSIEENSSEIENYSLYNEYQRQTEQFAHLLERGFQYGILFVVNTANPKAFPHTEFQVDCTLDCSYAEDPFDCLRIEGVEANGENWLFKYLADGKIPVRKRQQTNNAADCVLATSVSEEDEDAMFQMDTVGHVHAFVIGRTGIGKSVLLHNILTGLVAQYGPEDLMLYLLDLKEGGVEFNRYRGLPHLRSLLVDYSDIQIVLEIMRDIEILMRERGKTFRDAEVSNIKEYNRAHPETKMAQVLVVIDECHKIFSLGEEKQVTNEQKAITSRLAKIAKEGRSQGIHLVLSTQTLSDSQIPASIQKNITDYYLLNCASSDSEQLVHNSSDITRGLTKGKVYYHHTDKQMIFQGAFMKTEGYKRAINETIEHNKAKGNHGQFYFNGSQTFMIDKHVVGALANSEGKQLCGAVGCKINLQQDIVDIDFPTDYAQNILATGINNEGQLDRTSMAFLATQLIAAHKAKTPVKTYVIDCSPKGAEVSDYLQMMAQEGWISLCRASKSENVLKKLCKQVQEKRVSTPTMLYILGQDRFSEMKHDLAFNDDSSKAKNTDILDPSDLLAGLHFSETNNVQTAFHSYKKAVYYLLDNGPSAGIHTFIQLDKPSNLLFEESLSSKFVTGKFKHIIMLQSNSNASWLFGIDDSLQLGKLSADPERLRAYYYNDDDGESILFSPFERLETYDIETIINS